MRRTLRTLSDEECRALLASAAIGRFAVVVDGYPEVFPVNYAVHGERLLVRTDPGVKLTRARFKRVCLQLDGLDEEARAGWAVLVKGVVHTLRPGDPEHDALRRVADGIAPWAGGDKAHVLVILPVSVTGRRIVADDGPPPAQRAK